MKYPNSTVTMLSPKAIKMEQAFSLVCEVGKEIVYDVQDQAFAFYDRNEVLVQVAIMEVKAGIDAQKKRASSHVREKVQSAFFKFRSDVFRGCSSVMRSIPPFGSTRSVQRRDVCNMNVGITLALILTVILITVYAYRSFKWLISKIRLAIASRVQAVPRTR